MASKRILPFFILFLILGAAFSSVEAYESEEPNDATVFRDSTGDDLSGKTDAELVGMVRELKGRLEKDPGNADLHYRLSAIYATLFDRTRTQKGPQSREWILRSRDSLERVLMIRPEDKVAHYNLGVVYKRFGQMERAREELKKAIRLCDPEQDVHLICVSWLQIGSVYEEQGFFDEAREAYLQAREFDYGNEDIQEAIRTVEAKRKTPESGGVSPTSGMPLTGGPFVDPRTAAAMGRDPNMQNQEGLGQALPALGQMLMQQFGGGEDSSAQGE